MTDDRKSPHRRQFDHVVLIAAVALVAAFVPLGLSRAAPPITLQVAISAALPGFHRADLSRYIAHRMAEAQLPDWRFAPAADDGAARDRVEWRFTLNPYAGGKVHSFARSRSTERAFGVYRPITIEARLYLNGEYQTLVEKQAIIQGGQSDPDLAAAVASVTQNLLGPSGAYRAIDTGPLRAYTPR
jgi:hypothetical protein